jgi:predicted pyridoxine 5'-phosphate oxidase superfamily flavin-nucleotide-binding protein
MARGRDEEGLGRNETEFLAAADSFYLATVSETGWPYVQHRGGPPGFVKVLRPQRIAFADFRGNRQYVTTGNAARNDRAALIFVDYANRSRLKLLGHLRFVDAAEADPNLLKRVELPDYDARIERIALIDVAAFDWNCPQHITQRFTLDQIAAAQAAVDS